jgi:hypothetical protein
VEEKKPEEKAPEEQEKAAEKEVWEEFTEPTGSRPVRAALPTPPRPPSAVDAAVDQQTSPQSARPQRTTLWRKPLRDYGYRLTFLGVWAVLSVLFVLDRFTWNIWSRQSMHVWGFCETGCGNDFYCPDEPFCLQDGPLMVKVWDVLNRISARLIITTTTVEFLTVARPFWNVLASWPPLKDFLWNVHLDNIFIHRVGGWLLTVVVIVHVWSLFLPSVFSCFSTRFVVDETSFSLPAQVKLPMGAKYVDVGTQVVTFGADEAWRLFWMTALFAAIIPLSMSICFSNHNWSLSMLLHVGAGIGFFVDSARRKSHPHVWLLNLPFFMLYVVSRVAFFRWYHVQRTTVTRTRLGEGYLVLTWKATREQRHGDPLCATYWLRCADTLAVGFNHKPFTCATARVQDSRFVEPRLHHPVKALAPPDTVHANNPHWPGYPPPPPTPHPAAPCLPARTSAAVHSISACHASYSYQNWLTQLAPTHTAFSHRLRPLPAYAATFSQ